jgi:hypothetical protein
VKRLTFSTGAQVEAQFGAPILAHRKTLVKKREVVGEEVFSLSYGDLTAVQGVDYVLEPLDGSHPYPCKIDIFADSWEETVPNSGVGVYRRKALAKIVPVPLGFEITLETLEGDTKVYHPDYIAIGVKDEVYSNGKEWVDANLDILSQTCI